MTEGEIEGETDRDGELILLVMDVFKKKYTWEEFCVSLDAVASSSCACALTDARRNCP
jgi:hypothetical protein